MLGQAADGLFLERVSPLGSVLTNESYLQLLDGHAHRLPMVSMGSRAHGFAECNPYFDPISWQDRQTGRKSRQRSERLVGEPLDSPGEAGWDHSPLSYHVMESLSGL